MWAPSPAAVRTTRAPPRSRRLGFPRTGRDSWYESFFLLLSHEQTGNIRRHCMTHSILRQYPTPLVTLFRQEGSSAGYKCQDLSTIKGLKSTHKWGCRGRSPLPEREVSSHFSLPR